MWCPVRYTLQCLVQYYVASCKYCWKVTLPLGILPLFTSCTETFVCYQGDRLTLLPKYVGRQSKHPAKCLADHHIEGLEFLDCSCTVACKLYNAIYWLHCSGVSVGLLAEDTLPGINNLLSFPKKLGIHLKVFYCVHAVESKRLVWVTADKRLGGVTADANH